jgi:carbonic anhydrase
VQIEPGNAGFPEATPHARFSVPTQSAA